MPWPSFHQQSLLLASAAICCTLSCLVFPLQNLLFSPFIDRFFHNDFAPSRDTCVQRGYLFSNLTVLPDWRPRFIPPVLRGYFPISSTGCNYATTLADTLHGQMFFEEWYTDVPGLNAAFPISVTLALNPTTGLYGYSAGSFFPSTPWGYKLEVRRKCVAVNHNYFN